MLLANVVSILSIFKIILFEFDYRTVNVFTSSINDDDVELQMMNILRNYSKPTQMLNFNSHLSLNRMRCEGASLNVIFVANNTLNSVDEIKRNISPNDISLIVDDSFHSNTQLAMNNQNRMRVSNKVLIINKLTVLELLHHGMNILPLYPFDVERAKAFVRSFVHSTNYLQREKSLTIFFQYLTPRSMIAFLRTGSFYIGSDGSITEILLKRLNATGIFVSDVGRRYPAFVSTWNATSLRTRDTKMYRYYKNALTNNLITDNNRSITVTADLHMSPYVVEQDYEDQKLNLTTERLYPHERDCVVVIVPKQMKPRNFLTKAIRNGDIQSVVLATVALIVTRVLIERAAYNDWFAISFRTIGILLNQVAMKNYNVFESAWTNIVKGFSVIATIALSAIIYNNLVKDQYSEIDTIDDLIASNLTVLAPQFLENNLKLRLSVSRPQLLKNIAFKGIEAIGKSITELNFSFAYILRENPARNYLKLVRFNAKKGDAGRIMTEHLYCDLNSYRIDLMSNYKKVVDDFVLRIFENGLYNKHLQWANALLNAIFRPPPSNTTVGSHLAFTLNMMSGVFYLYVIGAGTSCIAFLIEIVYVKCLWR